MKTLLFSFQKPLVFLLVGASLVFSALGDELPTAKPGDVGVSAKKLERITEFAESEGSQTLHRRFFSHRDCSALMILIE